MKCPNCAFDAPLDMHYCGQCGTYLKRVCMKCGYANPLDYEFCGMCGVRFGEAHATKTTKLVTAQKTAPLLSEVTQPGSSLEHSLQGERRVATIILADVQGSTDLLEHLGTEAWVEMMNRVFQALEAEIYRFGGKVDQFRGDGLVAFFGATSAHEDDPERAVLAALAMQQAAKRYAVGLAEQLDIDLRLRVGVNTGEVIVTSVGDHSQYSEDTAMGEAVAVAARMESFAEPGTVLVSENTYRLAQKYFVWESLGEIRVKGVSKPIAVYRPLVPSARVDSLHTFGLPVPLIGREEAFTTLNERVNALYAGRGGIVMISGERGIGKSFLLAEVRRHFSRQDILLSLIAEDADDGDAITVPDSLIWLLGRCRSYDQSSPYSMWADLLHTWLNNSPGDPPEEMERRLRQQLGDLWRDEDFNVNYPSLANFLSLPLETPMTDQPTELDGEIWRQRFFQAIRSWLEALSQVAPLVISFSDMQWADTASLTLLKSCLSLCDTQSLLWLLVYRPIRTQPIWEFRHHVETEYPHRVSTLTLPALTEGQSRMMIERLIGVDVLSPQTEALILDKADGNPYFIQELIHTLIDNGNLVQDTQTGEWQVTQDVTSLDLPDSLQNLLMARIDRLSPGEKRVLQMASVIGQLFWSDVLQALAGEDFALQTHLTALQRAQLIRDRERVPQLGMAYDFRSTLICDVTYEGLLSTQRAVYHGKVADYLSHLVGDDEGVVSYNFMAYHHHHAGNLAQEVSYLLKAAEHFRKIYANTEAMEHYNRILGLLDTLESQVTADEDRRTYLVQRFQALDGRRGLYFMAGRFEDGWEDASALLPLARQLHNEPTWLIDALLRQPGVSYWRSHEEQINGTALVEEALVLSQQLGDRHREMQALTHIAGHRYNIGDATWQDFGGKALDLSRTLGDRRYEVQLLIAIGGIYAFEDRELSMHYLEMALPISQDMHDPQLELSVLEVMGRQLERSEDYYHRLKDYHEESLRISREIGDRPAESQALMFCGQLRALYLGDYETGLSMLEQGRAIIKDSPGEIFYLLRVVQVYIEQGRYSEAETYLEQSEHAAKLLDSVLPQIGIGLVKMLLYNAQQKPGFLLKALDLSSGISQLVALDGTTERTFYQQYKIALACETSVTYYNLARVIKDEIAKKTYGEQALIFSQIALDSYEAFGFVHPIECTSEKILYYHSKALAMNGRQAEAEQYLTRAYTEMLHKQAMIPVDSYLHRTYLENIPLHQVIRKAYLAEVTAEITEETTL